MRPQQMINNIYTTLGIMDQLMLVTKIRTFENTHKLDKLNKYNEYKE